MKSPTFPPLIKGDNFKCREWDDLKPTRRGWAPSKDGTRYTGFRCALQLRRLL